MQCAVCKSALAHPAYGTRCEDCFADSMGVCEPVPCVRVGDSRPKNVEREIRENAPDDYEQQALRAEGAIDDD